MKKMFLVMAVAISCVGAYSCHKDDDDDNDHGGGTGVSVADSQFVLKAALSNTAEKEAGALAAAKATDAGIKEFGAMMVADHTMAQEKLQSLADSLNLHAPDSVDAEHAALKQQLQSLSGREFDSVYINSQVKDHIVAVDLFTNESANGNNSQVRGFASRTLPTLQMHLEHADSLKTNF